MTHARVLVLTLAVLVAGCGAVSRGFEPESSSDTGQPGWHIANIDRSFETTFEEELIASAENVAPSFQDNDADAPEARWWIDSFDGVRIAGAITSDAISYYIDLSESFRNGDFSESNNIAMLSSELAYTASADRRPEYQGFQDVYVVFLELSWGQYCSNTCAMGFDKDRQVVFDAEGNFLAVFGDGAPLVPVS